MNDASKVKPTHVQRAAFVYIRQSTPAQVEYNRESTARQYALLEEACQLGWATEQVTVIDEDLGVTGSGFAERPGFARMTAEVALGHVGIVFALEVSRMARNNADWYRLFDLCCITDTLVADSDGLYHPALFNDRLVLGLNRPDSYSTSYSTSRGSGNLLEILLEPEPRPKQSRPQTSPTCVDRNRRPCASALDEWRSRSVNLLGILLGHQPHVPRASRQTVAAADVSDMQ